jgi:hypothetical protein
MHANAIQDIAMGLIFVISSLAPSASDAEPLDLFRFRGGMRACDQGIWYDDWHAKPGQALPRNDAHFY